MKTIDDLCKEFPQYADVIQQIAASDDEVIAVLPPPEGEETFHNGSSVLIAWIEAFRLDAATARRYFLRFIQQPIRITA